MKKIAIQLFVGLALTVALSSYARPEMTLRSMRATNLSSIKSVKAFSNSADTPEIKEAFVDGDSLDISILVPQYREPESLEIRSVNDDWTGVNLFNSFSGRITYPYVDEYNRQCWHFRILLSPFATPGGDYVIRFKDWTQAVANEVTITY